MKVEVAFRRVKEAYGAVSSIRDLPDSAVWEVRVTPLAENRATVELPQVLLERQPEVLKILRKHGGILSVRQAPLPRIGAPAHRGATNR